MPPGRSSSGWYGPTSSHSPSPAARARMPIRLVNSCSASRSFSSRRLTSNIRRESMLLSPPRRSQRERSDFTRAALTGAATALFAKRGFHGASAELVVRRAGGTPGALYHHFGDKRGLFRAAFETVEQKLAARVAAAAGAGGGPRHRLQPARPRHPPPPPHT